MYAEHLIVVAHPGDEMLGCARLLLRDSERCHVLYVADGLPSSLRTIRKAGAKTADEYVAVRCSEIHAALTAFGLRPEQTTRLGLGEHTVLAHVERVIQAILGLVRADRPLELHTHPFEGGDPDADAVCFSVHKALERLRAEGEVCPTLYEFTSFHARDGLFRAAEFLNPYPSAQITLLTEAECAMKREALRCLRSRYNLIARFSLCEEHWRRADGYDFGERPHDGPLYYELARTGFTWEHFAKFVESLQNGSASQQPKPSPTEGEISHKASDGE
ncbi:MAG: PIG-L family deacetylase [Bryobacterales bacterium]|nr:PIG-L family deacetylase [Bryobacterales bacterium]